MEALTSPPPGFKDPVHGTQETFRALLDALARPGMVQTSAIAQCPKDLTSACGAACLTLMDLETVIWLQPGINEAVKSWLLFHTGCRFTDAPKTADFAVITSSETMPKLDEFNWGSGEYPEASTSLLIQLSSLQGGHSVTLQGPGILEAIAISPPLPQDFWDQWREMTTDYPLGVDLWCFSGDRVLGLPRTARVVSHQEEA